MLLVGIHSGTAALENTVVVLQKVNIELLHDPRYIPKRTENKCSHKNWYANVHNRSIHDSPK